MIRQRSTLMSILIDIPRDLLGEPVREGPGERMALTLHKTDRRATSRYPKPHQGAQECQRRMRQREKGGAA